MNELRLQPKLASPGRILGRERRLRRSLVDEGLIAGIVISRVQDFLQIDPGVSVLDVEWDGYDL
jgi:hypothetical protein